MTKGMMQQKVDDSKIKYIYNLFMPKKLVICVKVEGSVKNQVN